MEGGHIKKKPKRSTLYMAVTPDKYELPVYVAESCEDLAERYHLTKSAIYTSISQNKSGSMRGVKFVKIKMKDMKGD